jgi:hypothetical protein
LTLNPGGMTAPVVRAQDWNAIARGRLCFDMLMPIAYFCFWPLPYLNW